MSLSKNNPAVYCFQISGSKFNGVIFKQFFLFCLKTFSCGRICRKASLSRYLKKDIAGLFAFEFQNGFFQKIARFPPHTNNPQRDFLYSALFQILAFNIPPNYSQLFIGSKSFSCCFVPAAGSSIRQTAIDSERRNGKNDGGPRIFEGLFPINILQSRTKALIFFIIFSTDIFIVYVDKYLGNPK